MYEYKQTLATELTFEEHVSLTTFEQHNRANAVPVIRPTGWEIVSVCRRPGSEVYLLITWRKPITLLG